jgi:23S rRNA (uridine2552-2'-O)-methyltransferase
MSRPPIDPKQIRTLHTRVKTAKGRKLSSKIWLERQLNDPYVAAAKQAGYRSRAAWKLAEIDQRFRLMRHGAKVLDLGSAPGGWTQVAVDRAGGGNVVAIDINPMEPVAGSTFLQIDFLSDDAEARVRAALAGPLDVVLSDMHAPSTGHRQTDHIRIMLLCEAAAHFARQVLAPGGSFVAKVLRGGTENELLTQLKKEYAQVRHAKPDASRQDSAESYVVATGFRGAADA